MMLSATAHADAAFDEVSAGGAQKSASGPRPSSWVADKLGGMWDPSDDWQLRVDLLATRDEKPTSNVLLATAGLEYDPDDHWFVRATVAGSPSSTTTSTISVPTARGSTDAGLRSNTASTSGGLQTGWETASGGNFETIATASATATYFDSLQQITSVRDGAISVAQIQSYCTTHTCSPQLIAALDAQRSNLTELVLDASLTETLWRDTDVGVEGSYYAYDKDPMQVGYYTAAIAGRTATTAAGIGIAPLRYTVMPSVIERWGKLMAMASVSYGSYVDDQGIDVTAAVRVQYRIGGVKLWTKLMGSRDTDQMQNVTKSGSAALGVQLRW